MTSIGYTRRSSGALTIGLVAAIVAATATISTTAQAADATTSVGAAVSDQQLAQFRDALRERTTRYASVAPVGPNPSTSLVPPGTPRDFQGWAEQSTRLAAQRMASQATKQARARENQRVLPGITATEDEPAQDEPTEAAADKSRLGAEEDRPQHRGRQHPRAGPRHRHLRQEQGDQNHWLSW